MSRNMYYFNFESPNEIISPSFNSLSGNGGCSISNQKTVLVSEHPYARIIIYSQDGQKEKYYIFLPIGHIHQMIKMKMSNNNSNWN